MQRERKRERERHNTQFQVKETQAAKRFRPPEGSRAIISRSIKARRVTDGCVHASSWVACVHTRTKHVSKRMGPHTVPSKNLKGYTCVKFINLLIIILLLKYCFIMLTVQNTYIFQYQYTVLTSTVISLFRIEKWI